MKILEKINTWARNKYGISQKKFIAKGADLKVTTIDGQTYSICFNPKIVSCFDEHVMNGKQYAESAIKGNGPLKINSNLYIERCNILKYDITLHDNHQTLLGYKHQNITLEFLYGCICCAVWGLAWLLLLVFSPNIADSPKEILALNLFSAIFCMFGAFFTWIAGLSALPSFDEDGNLKR